jgi:hypothetical protein
MPDDYGTPPPAAPAPASPDPAKKPLAVWLKRWRGQSRLLRWSAYIGGGLFVLLLLLIILLPVIMQPIIRRVLQSQIADNLNATLEIDDLSYHRFLGVSIGHARLTTPGPDGKALPVVELSGLDVSLARLPFGGPIVVDHCIINQPAVDLVRLPSGEFQITKNFLKPTPPSNTKFTKLSDYLAVKHFELNQMTVRMTDMKAGGPVQQLLQLDVKADLAGGGMGTYGFHVALDHKPMADLSVDGSVDTDGYALNFKNLAISTVAPGEPDIGQLPEQVQTIIKQYGLTGQGVTITIAGGGSVAVDLEKGHWSVKNMAGELKLTSTAATKLATGAIEFNLSGGGPIPTAASPAGMSYLASLDPGTALDIHSDPANGINIMPPRLPATVKNVSFAAKFADRTLTIDRVAATVDGQVPAEADLGKLPDSLQAICKQYGLAGQGVAITIADGGSATVDLAKNHWVAKGIAGELKLTSTATSKLATGAIAFSINGGGPTAIEGDYLALLDAGTSLDLHTDPANAISITPPQLPVTVRNVSLAAKFADRTLTFSRLAGTVEAEVPAESEMAMLPASLQSACKQYGMAGQGVSISIADGGNASVDLVKNHWMVRGLAGEVKMTSTAATKLATGAIDFSVNSGGPITGAGSDYLSSLDSATALDLHVDPANAISIATPQLPATVKNLAFAAQYSNRVLTVADIAATVDAKVPAEAELGKLPAPLQSFCKQYQLGGQGVTITLDGGGCATVDLAENHWAARRIGGKVTLTSTAATPLATGAIAISFSGGGPIRMAGGSVNSDYLALLDPGSTLSVQTDPANALNLAAPQLPARAHNVAFAAQIADRTLTISGLAATLDVQVPAESDLGKLPASLQAVVKQYQLAGQDVTFTLASGGSASVDLAKNHWALNGIQGDVKLTSEAQNKLATGDIQFNVSGGGPIPGKDVPMGLPYIMSLDQGTLLDIHTDPNNSVNITTSHLPQPLKNATFMIKYADRTLTINNVAASYGSEPIKLDDTTIALQAKRLKLQNLHLAAAGGTVTIDSVDLNLAAPFDYTVNQVVYDKIDLRDVKDLAQITDPGGHISGTAHGTLHATGTLPPGAPPLATVSGNGDFDVENGDFWDIPVLSAVADKVSPNLQGSGRIGSAAGVFTMGNGKLNFSKLAVSSPLVGVQGSGDVGMVGDNQLDMNMIVAPLGDWKKAAEQVGVPGLGDILAKVQNSVNKVSANVLYSFHVTGPAAKPGLQVVPAPALKGDLQDLFGKMGKSGGLLDLLKPKK